MSDSPLRSILPVPGSGSTSEPGTPPQREMAAESGMVAADPCPERIRLGGNCCWIGFADGDCDPATRWTEEVEP